MMLEINIALNIVGMCIVLTLFFVYRMGMTVEAFPRKLYRLMLIITAMQCAVEAFTFYIDGKTFWGADYLIPITNSFLYVANILLAFVWVCYVEYKLFHSIRKLKEKLVYLSIPAVIVSIGAIVNLFVPVFYRVNEQNVYSRTILVVIPFIFTYGYLLYSVVIAYNSRKNVDRYMVLPVAYFLIPVFIGSVIQFFFYGVSFIWISVAIALVALSGSIQNEAAYIDALSGLYNRQYLNSNIHQILKRNDDAKYRAGIMLDIDCFKSINDLYGHQVGDKAIRQAALILRSATRRDDVLVRYAGDEFIIFLNVNYKEDVEKIVARIQKKAEEFNHRSGEPYRIVFSMGTGIYDGGQFTCYEFLEFLDQRMYQDKKAKREDQ